MTRTFFLTGTAGFIGYHLAELLLREGHTVHGYDGITDYYDVHLKHARHERLRQHHVPLLHRVRSLGPAGHGFPAQSLTKCV